jgi:hypothetical protein
MNETNPAMTYEEIANAAIQTFWEYTNHDRTSKMKKLEFARLMRWWSVSSNGRRSGDTACGMGSIGSISSRTIRNRVSKYEFVDF